ncbi:MAG: phosphate acyltransferase PlsX, partial [Candidatus Binatia bacterium]
MSRPIVVDAMGSDAAPVAEILGAVEAKHRFGIEVVLAGDRRRLEPEMRRLLGGAGILDVLHAPEAVGPAEH